MTGGSSVAEQSVIVERVEDTDKEKKKKRRSNRRSKHNSACNSGNEARGESSASLKSKDKTKSLTSSMSSSSSKQQELQQTPDRASDVAFNSMPTMHINEKAGSSCDDTAVDVGGRFFWKSWLEPIAYVGSSKMCMDSFLHFQQVEGSAPKKLFAPYWPIEAVNEALEKGEAFKALFRVNAHNRLEAYCKIDGVPTDVLINGVSSQNRAVEGDIVVIKFDPVELWTKMKGSNGSLNNSARVEDCNSVQDVNGPAGNSYKGKGKIDVDCEYADCRSEVLVEKGFYDKTEVTTTTHDYVNGHQHSISDSSHMGLFPGQSLGLNSVERLASMTNQFPLKRPTGKVVALFEKSLRRDAIVGFLNVKQWFSYRELNRKDAKKNSAIFDHEYVTLTPTDTRFPKMIVFVKDLPGCIKKRLEDGDVTIEMELLAALIEDWSPESPFPVARISHSFGRGGELEPQMNAILFQNAIHSADFPPEVLSCLSNVPWDIPPEELQTRRDLRDLCIFTIDPSTASDLDDALSVEKLSKDSFRVGVHVADVSYFVLPNTALDIEAQIRSTSVYMMQRKIQMLPSLLSEQLGSLNPGVDRLAFSMFWEINSTGDVLDHWIGRTVIRSCCKLSYEHAQDIIKGGIVDVEKFNTLKGYPQLHGQFGWTDVIRSVKCLHEISKTLKEKRFNDGALPLESAKVVYLVDEYGVPYDTRLSERIDSNFLVEEFMLLANMTAAEVISRAFPDSALLRRHPEPNMRKLKEFEAFCHKHGLELDTSSSGQFRQSLEKIREKLRDDSVLFDVLILYASKPMHLATYFCSGELKDNLNDWSHYALAVPLYTHFTSPLRRYPDIVVHRTLAAVIEAEELYLKHRGLLKSNNEEDVPRRYFTGIYFDKEAAESPLGKEALSSAALKYGIPSPELLSNVAAYCNERKLASRHAEDACEKLYMWVLLKKKKILLSDARVLGLGPRFMSVYIQKLAIERRIYYDEVEGLTVEWLESTSSVVLNLSGHKRLFKRGGLRNYMALGNVAWVVNPYDLSVETGSIDDCDATYMIDPGTFPLTLCLLSTIHVALYAIGGDDGPLEIGVRLFMSSYLK